MGRKLELLTNIGKAISKRAKKNQREKNRNPKKTGESSPGSSAFSSPENLKASNPGVGKKSRTKTESDVVKARRLQAKREKKSAAAIKKAATKKVEEVKKRVAKKVKAAGKKVDEALTPKKLKEEAKKLRREKALRAKKEKVAQKNPFADSKTGTAAFKKATQPRFDKQRQARLDRNKKDKSKLDEKISKAVGTRKKIIGSAAVGTTGATGAAALLSGKDKAKTSTNNQAQLKSVRRESSQAKDLRERLKKESSGDRIKRSNPAPATVRRAKVTGKDDSKGARNVGKGSAMRANVTREQLSKLGLDPSKKSSLTTYLNAYDRLGRRPKTKSDLAAKKNMGGMMKKKGYAMGGMSKKGYAMGGMAKKGYAKGGPAKKNMGGMMKKKGYSNGGLATKARGVGAATRGYGAIMKK